MPHSLTAILCHHGVIPTSEDENHAAHHILQCHIRRFVQSDTERLCGAERLNLGIVLYPGFEVLDVYGPLEMWAYVPEFNVILIAEEEGPVASAQGAVTLATHSFDTAPPLDIVMVPGGIGSRTQVKNEKLLDYLREVNETTRYTTSVSTGSALLAKAGILDGHRATTNKRAFYLAEEQSGNVDWVESGKMFTSSGVSAGTDMALGLIAKPMASSRHVRWPIASNTPGTKMPTRTPSPGTSTGWKSIQQKVPEIS